MARAGRHTQHHSHARLSERRQQVAHEAARLMARGGILDYQQAKLKAAQRLGFDDNASLPRNEEVEAALREYQRLFLGHPQQCALRERREAAAQALEFLAEFSPRLVGPVLEGTADANSPVLLHLHADDADAVPRFLEQAGIPLQSSSHRMRLDRSREDMFPAWVFSADGIAFDLIVLPADTLRQAPLTSDHRPTRRASLWQLRQLLAADESTSRD